MEFSIKITFEITFVSILIQYQLLLKARDKGLVLKPDKTNGLEFYVDAGWAGAWFFESSMGPLSTYS